jgi:hypothetical protein
MGDDLVCFYGFQLQGPVNVFFEINCGSFHGTEVARGNGASEIVSLRGGLRGLI